MRRAASWLVGLGAAAVVASGFLPWLHLGRDYSGYRLSRLVRELGDDYPLVPPSWVGVVWWVVPVLAVVCWVVLFAGARPGVRPVHGALGLALVAVALTFLGVAVHYGRATSGQVVAVAGALAIVAGALVDRRRRRPIEPIGSPRPTAVRTSSRGR